VHLVGFIIRIYHDARSLERPTPFFHRMKLWLEEDLKTLIPGVRHYIIIAVIIRSRVSNTVKP